MARPRHLPPETEELAVNINTVQELQLAERLLP